MTSSERHYALSSWCLSHINLMSHDDNVTLACLTIQILSLNFEKLHCSEKFDILTS